MSGMTKDRRQSELAKIHIGKKQLFDDGGDYRDMLKACGAEFRPARKSGLKRNRPAPPPETERQIRKIRAMLAEDGLPDAYAEAILKQMCSHPHRVPLEWASSEQLGKVIAALSYRKKRMQQRAGRKAADA